jgi:hypothetical protein
MAERLISFPGPEVNLPEGWTVALTTHPGDKAIVAAGEVDAAIGPAMIDIRASLEKKNEEEQKAAYYEALKGLFRAIPGQKLLDLARLVLAYTSIQGDGKTWHLSKDADFKDFFGDHKKALIPLMNRSIRVNDFLDLDLSELMGAVMDLSEAKESI